MKHHLQKFRTQARGLFLWGLVALFNFVLTDAFGQNPLPAGHEGSWSNMSKTGWTAFGLGTDLPSNLKGSSTGGSANLNSVGDYILVQFDVNPGDRPGALSYSINMSGLSSAIFDGEFKVEESADGTSWAGLKTFTNDLRPVGASSGVNAGTQWIHPVNQNTRYIRFRFSGASAANRSVYLDAIRIDKISGPEINVTQEGVDYLTGATYTFQSQNIGTNSNPIVFTIQNVGSTNLTLTGNPLISITGANANEFIINHVATATTIGAGSASTFSVSFAPRGSIGGRNASIRIANDDSDEGDYIIKLTGAGDVFASTVTAIAPTAGQIGSQVVITGTNLINTTAVTFNGVAASIDNKTDDQLVVTVPAGAGTGVVAVTNIRGTVVGPEFTVIAQAAPEITGFTPAEGPIGDTVVITGANFSSATIVRFNTIPTAFTVNNAGTEITATVPANATTGRVSVTTPGGTVESADDFTVLMLPVINSISPNYGSVGQIVTITGINFVDVVDVSFYGIPANYEPVSDSEIVAEVPQGARTGAITVTTPGGTASSETFNVVVLSPFISELSPASGQVFDVITITGVNFTDLLEVSFSGGIPAAFELMSDEEIMVEVPDGAISGPITVTTSGGSIESEVFTVVVPEPTITEVNPTSALVGSLITITGSNFTTTSNVSFNGISATFNLVNDSQLEALVPVNAITGAITITTAGGVATSATFTVIIPNTTYTWRVGSGNWSDPNSWTPVRNAPTTADILIFDGEKTSNPTINLDFASAQTVGQLRFLNNITANLSVASDKTLSLDNGVAGTDFSIAAGSTVNVTNSAANAKLNILITAGETGVVAGNLVFQGAAGTAAHRITAEELDGLSFQGTFRTATGFVGNPFGTTNLNTVRFTAGSVYRNQAGDSPFGAAAPSSVLLFDPNSLYRHETNTAPDLNNRVYSNFEVNSAAFAQIVAGTGNLTLNNLTVTSATNFDINLSGIITITGNINVAGGALNFVPAAVNTINMSGTGTKTISGTGIMSLGANARLFVPVGVTADLQKQIIGSGNVIVDGTIKTNVTAGFAAGENTALQTGLTATLKPGSTVDYYGIGAQSISPVNYANLVISGNRLGANITLDPGTIRVSEAFTRPATNIGFINTGNTVEFTGAAQTIPVITYNNLIASGNANKSIAGNIQVNGALTVSTSTINTGANKITLNSNATINETQTNYVIGKVEATRTVTAGVSQNFGGLGLTLNPAAGSVSPGTTTVVRSTGIAPIQLSDEAMSITRLYDITAQNSSGLNTSMTLKYAPNELTNGQIESEMHMFKNSGDNFWGEQAGVYTYNTVARQVTLAGVTGFSSWTMGQKSLLLPVQLLNFTATRRGQAVQLEWTTAMEKDNKGFEVQVSTDAESFTSVGFINSKNSNTNLTQTYNFVDNKTKPANTLYYRLKQIDFSGNETYSAIKPVIYENEQVALEVTAFPNPFDENFTVVVNADAQKRASITITDAMGRKVLEKTVTLNKGSNDIKFELGKQYPAGIYIINLTTNNFQQHLRMVKK